MTGWRQAKRKHNGERKAVVHHWQVFLLLFHYQHQLLTLLLEVFPEQAHWVVVMLPLLAAEAFVIMALLHISMLYKTAIVA